MTDFQVAALKMLEEAQVQIMTGQMESLVILGRSPKGGHLSLLAHDPQADICSLLGFAHVVLARAVQYSADELPGDRGLKRKAN